MNARAALVSSRPGAARARAHSRITAQCRRARARLLELAIFPVKGLGAVRLLRARVEHHGLVDPASGLADRGVMLAVRQPGETPDGEGMTLGLGQPERGHPSTRARVS